MFDGKLIGRNFGINDKDWTRIDRGILEVTKLKIEISFHDLTGFSGRCDAIYLMMDKSNTPSNSLQGMEALREDLLGIKKVHEENVFDFVIIGGGMEHVGNFSSPAWCKSCPGPK